MRKPWDFYIKLDYSHPITRARNFKIHIAIVVLIALEICQHFEFLMLAVRGWMLGNRKPHCDSCNWFFKGTPASIIASVEAHTVAIEDDPFDERISDTTRSA